MKKYDEIAARVLRRRDEHNAAVTKRNRIIAQIGVPTVSLCLAAIIGVGMWQAGDLGDPPRNTEDAVIPGIPDVTGSGDGTNAVNEIDTELVESPPLTVGADDPTVPDGDTKETGRTPVTTPAMTTAPAVNRVPEVKETSQELAIVTPWEDLNISGKYPEAEFNGITYTSMRYYATEEDLGQSLGRTTGIGYDIYTDSTYSKDATVYAMNGILPECAVILEFDGFDGYYVVYTNSWYKPESLGDFVDALNLKENLSFSGRSYRTTYEYGSYLTVEYESPDLASAVWEMLLDDPTPVNCIDDMPTFYHSAIGISSNVDVLGINNKSITLTEDGYLWTNILDTAKAFYIGEEKVQKFISYVEENCALVTMEAPSTTSGGNDGKVVVSEPEIPEYAVEMTTSTRAAYPEDTAYDERIPEEELIAEPYIPEGIEEAVTVPAYDPRDTVDAQPEIVFE